MQHCGDDELVIVECVRGRRRAKAEQDLLPAVHV